MTANRKMLLIGSKARATPTKRYPQGFNYPKYHELKDVRYRKSGEHPYLVPTVKKWQKQIRTILGRNMRVSLKKR